MDTGVVIVVGHPFDSGRLRTADLQAGGLSVVECTDLSDATSLIQEGRCGVLVCGADDSTPSTWEVVRKICVMDSGLPVVVIGDDASLSAAPDIFDDSRCVQVSGSEDAKVFYDVVSRLARQHRALVENRIQSRNLAQSVQKNELGEKVVEEGSGLDASELERQLVGQSPAMVKVRRMIADAARADVSVVIHGGTGTGKDVVARLLHEMGRETGSGSFVKVACPALAGHLLESELFGHEAGAFDGASRSRPGRLELAREGTAFLDEIGEVPAAIQGKLLEVLESNTFTRLGGTEQIYAKTRVVAGTSVEPEELIASDEFRSDLYFRLSQYTIHLPALRERAEDIPAIVEHFLKKYVEMYGRSDLGVSPETMSKLVSYSWPGNVRELESAVMRFSLSGDEETLCSSFLDDLCVQAESTGEGTYRDNEKRVILQALLETRWNRRQAAKVLGISYNTLRRRIERYALNANAPV